ncbi:beta-1,3-glucanase family protein [Streptomyces sp. NPDC093707]|uniref:beta-1,3-glucanase family protein n=1 Tax=Streptomyces sp. NPDC093707 TaxID=3154984 RepID=UPI00344C7EB1
MITRRTLLGGLTAGAATAALAGRAAGAPVPRAAGPLPLHVVNDSGAYANTSVWIYVIGTAGDQQVHLTPDGRLAPVALADNGPDGFTDYAVPLAAGGTTTVNLSPMSGRIYVALGSKLKIKAVTDGNGRPALATPAGWVAGDPNYNVLHDSVEFTYDAGGMHCNTTMVDMFSVPISLRLTGAADQTTGTLKDGARDKIFADVKAAAGFDRLVIGDRRVIAPSHGLEAGLFAADYFAPAIDEAWSAYAAKDLTVKTVAGTFTGRTGGGQLTFHGPGTVSFAKPSTRDVLMCDGALAAPNDRIRGPIAAVLGSALNRSTLAGHATQPVTDPAAFYQAQRTHHYARAMHAATRDGKAYGFPFDDVGNFAAYVEDHAPKDLTLTLTRF